MSREENVIRDRSDAARALGDWIRNPDTDERDVETVLAGLAEASHRELQRRRRDGAP